MPADTMNEYMTTYTEKLRAFATELQRNALSTEAYKGIPYVFLPQYGTGYESAAVKMAFVGKETYGWIGWLNDFLHDAESGNWEKAWDMSAFQQCDYVSWTQGPMTRYKYWGFVMYLLADLYGINNWNALKKRSNPALSVLSSFAWGNVHAVETASSSGLDRTVLNPAAHSAALAAADKHLNSFTMLRESLRPDMTLITCGKADCDKYLLCTKDREALPLGNKSDSTVRAWKTSDEKLIINIPHPVNQKFSALKAAGYVAAIKELMDAAGLLLKLTSIRHWEPHVRDSAWVAETFSYCRVGAATKYQAVAAIASELRKCNKSIPAEALAWLMNELGHRTNYETTYEGGRGTYRLIKASYQRYEVTARIVANDIAEAFTLPDGSYAYN